MKLQGLSMDDTAGHNGQTEGGVSGKNASDRTRNHALGSATNPVYGVASPLGEVAGYEALRFEHG